MWSNYASITSRIKDPILWWDERGIPCYDPFRPQDVCDIYANEVALVEIECQSCRRKFRVAMHLNALDITLGDCDTLEWQVQQGCLFYGDPPRHEYQDTGKRCAGETMSSDVLRVVEFWEKKSMEWVRVPELERGLTQ